MWGNTSSVQKNLLGGDIIQVLDVVVVQFPAFDPQAAQDRLHERDVGGGHVIVRDGDAQGARERRRGELIGLGRPHLVDAFLAVEELSPRLAVAGIHGSDEVNLLRHCCTFP